MKTKWTYTVEIIRPPVFSRSVARADFISEVLNRRGLEGWELVSAIDGSHRSSALQLYFKRPL